jgi:hypothetical protein
MAAYEEIALSPNTQYQLLQLICQLPKRVQRKVEETGLSRGKATLLTHSRLKEYPEIQQLLANQIKEKERKPSVR